MKPRHFFIVLFIVFGIGLKVGLAHEGSKRRAEVAELRESTAKAQRDAAAAALVRLQAAQQRGDQLTVLVAESAKQIEALSKEKSDALKKATSGRACLGTAALRVLDTAPGLRVADLPQAAGSAVDADGPVATDTDIGQWSIAAGAQFELCRKRLGALIEWHHGER